MSFEISCGVFQSSPNPKVGRYRTRLVTVNGTSLFQSSPNPKVGRYDSKPLVAIT